MSANAIAEDGCLLFHGTLRASLPSIMEHGLEPHPFADEGPVVCLTEGRDQARANAWHKTPWTSSSEKSRSTVILTVDVSGLPLCVSGFVTCAQTIEPERISVWGQPPHGRILKARLLVQETGER